MEAQRTEARGTTATASARAGDRRQRRSPDQLLRDAWQIRHLLRDLDADDHVTRTKLLAARDQVRLEAAQQWHERGWRPITDAC